MAQTMKVSGVKTTIGADGNGNHFVQYHQTKVVEWNDDKIILDSGGWKTRTTALRMTQARNQFNLDFHVQQENFTWFLFWNEKRYPFSDGMRINRQTKQVTTTNGEEVVPC